jgi:putative glycosyltransferase (TIGR04372 family)
VNDKVTPENSLRSVRSQTVSYAQRRLRARLWESDRTKWRLLRRLLRGPRCLIDLTAYGLGRLLPVAKLSSFLERWARKHSALVRRLTIVPLQFFDKVSGRDSDAWAQRLAVFLISAPVINRLAVPLLWRLLARVAMVQLMLGYVGKADYTARLLNWLYRPYVKSRDHLACEVYCETMYRAGRLSRLCREFPKFENTKNIYVNRAAGIAHMSLGNAEIARRFFEGAFTENPHSYLEPRLIGRTYLLTGDYQMAAQLFSKSVENAPNTVMAHENYAGRYDIGTYVPPKWELENSGELLIYDNLGQMAEELVLKGSLQEGIDLYQKRSDYQQEIGRGFELPITLKRQVLQCFPDMDCRKPTKLLSYEWVVQFGHIGLLDSIVKMRQLGMLEDANYVLLAPANKVANQTYLSLWEEHYFIVRDTSLVDELFPYQRYLGVGFMVYRQRDGEVVYWTKAAAAAQRAWAERELPPILSLSSKQIEVGRVALDRLLTQSGNAPLPEGGWFVGLHVREGGFHGDAEGTGNAHRNARIEDYLEAVKEITAAGGWVVRLGDKSMSPFPEMERVIDYALSSEKSEAMDLFLLSQARFVIGTTSGLTTCAISFGAEMALANCISNDWQLWSDKTQFILRPLIDETSGKLVSLDKTYSTPIQGYMVNVELMKSKRLSPRANSSEEIRQLIVEKLDRLQTEKERKYVDSSPPKEISQFRKSIANNPLMFGAANPSPAFIANNPDLLSDGEGANWRVNLDLEMKLLGCAVSKEKQA